VQRRGRNQIGNKDRTERWTTISCGFQCVDYHS